MPGTPNDPCFDWKRPSFGGFNPQNKGQMGSRYILTSIFYASHCDRASGNPQQKNKTGNVPGVQFHRENGGTLGMVPSIINPIYTLYSGYLLGISLLKGSLWGLNS